MDASIRRTAGAVVSSSLNGDENHDSATALQRLDAFPADGLCEVEANLDGDAESLILHRDGAGEVRAWLNVCPHAGRRLDWAPGKFLLSRTGALVCPAHGATFDLHDGHCLSGPCRGQWLQAVALQVRDGQVALG